jgi:hypothetical protein
VKIHTRIGAETDVWADTGEAETRLADVKPHMEVSVHVLYDPERMPVCLYEVASSLHQTARHEVEHLLDEGYLALPGPKIKRSEKLVTQESWQKSTRMHYWLKERVRIFCRGNVTKKAWQSSDRRLMRSSLSASSRIVDYIASPRELHAFVMGFHAEARYRRVNWDVPMHEYIDAMCAASKMTHDESDLVRTMLTRWAVHVLPRAPISDATLSRYL